ncbi:hypothetical protein CPC08DRAFT_665341 [Agrocybe pediades]|nr:hypothetical protein CPC08DRAFT_665341 [Agrocybe pediades]
MASKYDDIDRNTTLCLACSSSLPPVRQISSDELRKIHITKCCQRPICPSCIAVNPRLSRYDPCLACLGGVDLVASGSRTPSRMDGFVSPKGKGSMSPTAALGIANIDGSLRDEDTFVLGEDEEDEDDGREPDVPPPPYVPLATSSENSGPLDAAMIGDNVPQETAEPHRLPSVAESNRTAPYKYYLNRQDTLQGIALRFGVDVYDICRMNNLPMSVLRTMPHLLHTRSFLKLPPTAKPHHTLNLSPDEEAEREEKIAKERAEKKLQTLTKEEDWRVAKAYVSLAGDVTEQDAFALKAKESGFNRTSLKHTGVDPGSCVSNPTLESLALNQYLEDEEWEQAERRAGRGVRIPSFPLSLHQNRKEI